jgi:hypothetical protein
VTDDRERLGVAEVGNNGRLGKRGQPFQGESVKNLRYDWRTDRGSVAESSKNTRLGRDLRAGALFTNASNSDPVPSGDGIGEG